MALASPCVSVILPTYNRAHLLPRAIASVLTQSFADFELIIADDASTDNTEQLVRTLDDPRIVYVRAERNGGDASARNLGCVHARGEWLAFQDSDDEWLPDRLARQVALALSLPDANLIGGGSLRIAGTELTTHFWPNAGTNQAARVDFVDWMGSAIANLQSVLIRRTAFEHVGAFDTAFRAIGDADWVFRLIASAPSTLYSDRTLVALLHDTPGSLVNSLPRLAADVRRLLEKHANLLAGYPQAHARLQYRLALLELNCGRFAQSRAAARAAVAAEARYWRPWAYLGLSVVGERGVKGVRALSQRIRMARANE